MHTRVTAALAAILLMAATACSGGGILGKQYEYEEDLTLSMDGSATLVLNASLPALAALRGLDVPTDPAARLDREAIRAMFESDVTSVTRVSRPWRRAGRRFIQVRMDVADINRLGEVKPFAWSRYQFGAEEGQYVYRQSVGASALKPGTLQNYGWDGREIVAFRVHLPSKVLDHNARDLDTDAPLEIARGNILGWEQHLADRLDGRPLEVHIRMESQSILYRTLWIFGGAFTAAVLLLATLIWWTMRRGRDQDEPALS